MEKFKDLQYERPDLKELRGEYKRLLAGFRQAKSFEEADRVFLAMQGLMEKLMTRQTIAHVRNTMNMKDAFYDGEIQFFNKEMPKLMMLVKKVGKALLQSPFRAQMEEKYGTLMFKDMEEQQMTIEA